MMRRVFWLASLVLFTMLAEGAELSTPDWTFPGQTWDRSKTPEDLGLRRESLDEFKASMGPGSQGCVIKNGYLVYSWGETSQIHDWFSAGKPCISSLLFAAMKEGRISSPDSRIQPFSPGLKDEDRGITFRHLANMMSGYACADSPGARWSYNDYAIRLYIKSLDAAFGTRDNLVSAGRRLFVVPMQFEDGGLFEPSLGHVHASSRDFARMGWLWLNKGNWNGQQILPSEHFDAYVKAGVAFGTPRSSIFSRDDYLKVGNYGGGINQHDGMGIYGFNWWFNKCLTNPARTPPLLAWPSAPADTYLGLGRWGNEAIVIIPSLGMVVTAYNHRQPTWGDALIFDPPDPYSRLNHNLKLLTESVRTAPAVEPTILKPEADVLYDGRGVNAVSQSAQINFGLAAYGGFGIGGARSYLQFKIGTTPVESAKLKIYNYWGGPMYNGMGRLPLVTARLLGAALGTQAQVTEPAPGSVDAAWKPPADSDFEPLGADRVVGPFVGWYDWDITRWYNSRLGQTTTLMVRALNYSTYDFPLFEDREGTAFKAGAGGSAADTGPRIEAVPKSFDGINITDVEVSAGRLRLAGTAGAPMAPFQVIASPELTAPAADWMTLGTGTFDSSGRFDVSVPLAGENREMYFRLRAP